MRPQNLKNGSLPAEWDQYDIYPRFRWHIKRRFKLCRCDVALISVVVCLTISVLGGVI